MKASEKSDNKPGRKTIKWRGRKENRIEKQITKLSTEKTSELRCYQFPQRFVSK
jgi:hypothetical protein